MAVLEIGIPTGFAADKKSVTQHPLLKRTEDGDGKINLYFDEVLFSILWFKRYLFKKITYKLQDIHYLILRSERQL